MKPFSLQAVLDFRKKLQELAQHRLFEAQKTVEKIETRLLNEKTILQDTVSTLESLQKDGIDIGELIRYEGKITLLTSNIRAIEENLINKQKIVRKEHENLVNCSKEHQIMKRLKEEQNKSWQSYLNKKEAAMLDEVGAISRRNNRN